MNNTFFNVYSIIIKSHKVLCLLKLFLCSAPSHITRPHTEVLILGNSNKSSLQRLKNVKIITSFLLEENGNSVYCGKHKAALNSLHYRK